MKRIWFYLLSLLGTLAAVLYGVNRLQARRAKADIVQKTAALAALKIKEGELQERSAVIRAELATARKEADRVSEDARHERERLDKKIEKRKPKLDALLARFDANR